MTFSRLIFTIVIASIFTACSTKTVVIESTEDSFDVNSDDERVVLGKASDIESEEIKKLITNWLDTININNYVAQQSLRQPIYDELKRFYKFNLYQLAWSTTDAPNARSKDLLNELVEAKDHGLNPDDYGLRQLVYHTQQV